MSELLTGILAQIQDMDESHSRLHEEVKAEKQRREVAEDQVKRLTASRASLLEMLDERRKDIHEDIRLEENYRSAVEELDAAQAQLREARQEQAALQVARQDWEYDLANSKRELSQLRSEVSFLDCFSGSVQDICEVAELKMQVTTLSKEKSSIEKTIMKERQAFRSSRALGNTDTIWKNRVNQVKLELDHVRLERDRYKAMAMMKGRYHARNWCVVVISSRSRCRTAELDDQPHHNVCLNKKFLAGEAADPLAR
ncbi:hypothetical protein BSKO_04016 [Bryopsis sp. KO-2023]|nr:hypothetical protein BSKO_04016 [Bryopsis sp. KO-2023]